MRKFLFVFVILTAVAMLSACGGGNESTPTNNTGGEINSARLSGSYFLAEFGNETTPSGLPWTASGSLAADGQGASTYQVNQISRGTTGTLSFPYSVTAQGLLSIGSGAAMNTGQLSADGQYFHLLDTDKTDQDVIMRVGIKKATGLSTSTLSGEYEVYSLGGNLDGSIRTIRMKLAADGHGAGIWTVLAHSDGNLEAGNAAYAVVADGGLTLDGMAGQVSADGSVFLVADTSNPNGTIQIMIGVKKSSGKTNADLAGTYHFAETGEENGSPWASRLTLVAHGNGTGNYSVLADSDGGSGTGDSTYTVNHDGTFTLDGMTGILSGDGNFLVVVDTDSADNVLKIMVGIK